MEIKDVKIGDKVRVRKDLSQEELVKAINVSGLELSDILELQRRGEVTVKDIQDRDSDYCDWDSITIEEMGYYWPIELFEPVNKPNKVVIKSKEEQVQEDIQTVKDIIKRYKLKDTVAGVADSLIHWLEQFGQDNLSEI